MRYEIRQILQEIFDLCVYYFLNPEFSVFLDYKNDPVLSWYLAL